MSGGGVLGLGLPATREMRAYRNEASGAEETYGFRDHEAGTADRVYRHMAQQHRPAGGGAGGRHGDDLHQQAHYPAGVGAAAPAPPAGRGRAQPERRRDPADGQWYTRDQFRQCYGDDVRWDQAAEGAGRGRGRGSAGPAPQQAPAPAASAAALTQSAVQSARLGAPPQHLAHKAQTSMISAEERRWQQEQQREAERVRREAEELSRAAADERRIDPSDGRGYTKDDFSRFYGGLAEWSRAPPYGPQRQEAQQPPPQQPPQQPPPRHQQPPQQRNDWGGEGGGWDAGGGGWDAGGGGWDAGGGGAGGGWGRGAAAAAPPAHHGGYDGGGKGHRPASAADHWGGGGGDGGWGASEDQSGARRDWQAQQGRGGERGGDAQWGDRGGWRQQQQQQMDYNDPSYDRSQPKGKGGRKGGKGGGEGNRDSYADAGGKRGGGAKGGGHQVPPGKGGRGYGGAQSGHVDADARPPQVPRYKSVSRGGEPPAVPRWQDLPAWHARDELYAAVARANVCCVQGDTGCGKSSVVPLLLMQQAERKGERVNIAVTQPRRIAATSLAERVAGQLREEVGQTVGYRIGQEGKTSADTKLTFYTAGWLLEYLAHNPESLGRFTHMVLDEIHERDLDMDLLVLMVKKSVQKHPRLKVVFMSATVAAEQFLQYFAAAGADVNWDPVYVGRRRFPVHSYFLDELHQALPEVAHGGSVAPATRDMNQSLARFKQGERPRVDISDHQYKVCMSLINALAAPGVCFLCFLPGMAEIEQLNEMLLASRQPCPLMVFTVHSILPHDDQKTALRHTPADRAKVVLSTNIAESSVTIPDARYVIDFGVHRVVMYDDNRGMQSLCNTWVSKGSVKQRRGRCGRLAEGVCLHLYTRDLYENFPEFAAAEIINVPLENIYIKCKVLLEDLFRRSPKELLNELIDPPPAGRIPPAEKNLEDLGALLPKGAGGGVTTLGRACVSMPCTVQMTKLVLLGWAFGCAVDACVMAASLSVQDVFRLVTPQSVPDLSNVPRELARNYHARTRHDDGQFSEPIAYRNLFISYLKSPHGGRRQIDTRWVQDNCVSVARLRPFRSLVAELAAKFCLAVPDAAADKGLDRLSRWWKGEKFEAQDIEKYFTQDYDLLRWCLMGSLAPSFIEGAPQESRKETGRIRRGGKVDTDPLTAAAKETGIPPNELLIITDVKPDIFRRDPRLLHSALDRLCPGCTVTDARQVQGGVALRCIGVPLPSEVLQNMPFAAQVAHQLSRVPCRFPGVDSDLARLGNCNFANSIKWRPGHLKTTTQPYWRSPIGYLSDFSQSSPADDAKPPRLLGVAASFMGREGDRATASGVTLLPTNRLAHVFQMFLFLSELYVPVLHECEDAEHGTYSAAELWGGDQNADPLRVECAPGRLLRRDLLSINAIRRALNDLIENPTAAHALRVRRALHALRRVIDRRISRGPARGAVTKCELGWKDAGPGRPLPYYVFPTDGVEKFGEVPGEGDGGDSEDEYQHQSEQGAPQGDGPSAAADGADGADAAAGGAAPTRKERRANR